MTANRIGMRIFQYLLYAIVIVFTILPILLIAGNSFKTSSEMLSYTPSIWPKDFTLENYINVFANYDFGHYAKNSLIITLSAVGLSMVIATLCAFAISFLPFRWGKWITKLILLMQMLPVLITSIALFVIFSKVKLINTYASLILTYTAGAGGCQIAVILICGFLASVPKDLFEAAYIDGASPLKAFVKILIPIAAPGLLCTAIFIFIGIWQEFVLAMNLTTNQALTTLPVGLRMFIGVRSNDWPSMMAVSCIISFPALILFVCIQNFFVDHMAGALKD